MNQPKDNRRKQIFIKDSFQQQLILKALLCMLISINLIIILAQWLDSSFGAEFYFFSVFNLSVALLEILAFLLVYFIFRKVSFHIAGPVYAIERTLHLMNEGKLNQKLILRQHDQFAEVADAVNSLIENYAERLEIAQALLAADTELTAERRQQLQKQLQWFVTRDQQGG
jgi:signal transduction histidine kinase